MNRKILEKDRYSKLTNEINDYFTILEDRVTKLEMERDRLMEENQRLEKEVLKLKSKGSFWSWLKGLFKKSENEVVKEKFNTNPLDTEKLRLALNQEFEEGIELETQIIEDLPEPKSDPYLTMEPLIENILSAIEIENFHLCKRLLIELFSQSEDSLETYNLIKEKLLLDNVRVVEILVELFSEDYVFMLLKDKRNALTLSKRRDFNPILKLKLLKTLFINRDTFSKNDLEQITHSLIEVEFLNFSIQDRELLLGILLVLENLESPSALVEYKNYVSPEYWQFLLEYFSIFKEEKKAREFSRYIFDSMEVLKNDLLNNRVKLEVFNHMGNISNDIVISRKL